MVERLAERTRIASNLVGALQDDLALATAIKERREKPKSKRQLSNDGVLYSRDAKRSITDRRSRESAAADRKAAREAKKQGLPPPTPQGTQDTGVSEQRGDTGGSNELFFIDTVGSR